MNVRRESIIHLPSKVSKNYFSLSILIWEITKSHLICISKLKLCSLHDIFQFGSWLRPMNCYFDHCHFKIYFMKCNWKSNFQNYNIPMWCDVMMICIWDTNDVKWVAEWGVYIVLIAFQNRSSTHYIRPLKSRVWHEVAIYFIKLKKKKHNKNVSFYWSSINLHIIEH